MHEHYIFGLDVSVEYFATVHQFDSLQQTADDEGSAFLAEGLPRADDVEELPVAAHLHDCVEVIGIGEIPEHLDDVGVV